MIDILDVNDSGNTTDFVSPTKIKVIGCGGCGGNAVNTMIESGIQGVQFIALNTDVQHLAVSKAEYKIQIGKKLTNGLGAGMHPERGEAAAKEEEETIRSLLDGSDMVFITAGMGGGTGTGSAPIVANIARELGILTVAVVTTPFVFEGPIRMQIAEEGIKKLRAEVDSLIVIPNQRVFDGADKKPSAVQAFKTVDDILRQGVKGISEIITKTGLINRDFKDVETVMKGQGDAILGIGEGSGENRAVDAATDAINNKLLADTHIDGAKNILIKISGNEDVGIDECDEIVKVITASADPQVRVLWGLYIEPELEDKITVTVIATGFNSPNSSIPAEDAAVVEEKPQADSNIFSQGDFEKVLNPGKFTSPATAREAVTPAEENALFGRTPQPAANKDSGLGSLFDSAAREPAKPSSIVPPANFKNDGDLNKPACWRNLDNLSRSIDLTKK
ncbi:MAG: cell division protein FtsZ [Treponema sp.]|nr:cell division protein FtsZ [Treponema sp.]